MSSVVRMPGGRVRVVYFADGVSDGLASADAFRLSAAVVWRSPPARRPGRAPVRGRAPAEGLRALGAALRSLLHERRATRPPGFGPGAERETSYDAGRRVVVRGQAYALPSDGRTLVLLVDEGSEAGSEPHVTVRTVSTPILPRESFELAHPQYDPATVAVHRIGTGDAMSDPGLPAASPPAALDAAHPEWTAALRADPEVRAYLDAVF